MSPKFWLRGKSFQGRRSIIDSSLPGQVQAVREIKIWASTVLVCERENDVEKTFTVG